MLKFKYASMGVRSNCRAKLVYDAVSNLSTRNQWKLTHVIKNNQQIKSIFSVIEITVSTAKGCPISPRARHKCGVYKIIGHPL